MTGLSLAEVQKWMHHALVHPGGEDADALLEPSARLTAAERLGIYQHSYYARILACMDEQFPALRHALGAELFRDFAAEYLAARPPESYTLYDLGRRFPAYLEETRPEGDEPWGDFMIDLARFERAIFVLYDAPGNEGRPFADATVPDERLRLQPAFALEDHRFPVADYFHRVRRGEDPPLPPARRSAVALVRVDYLTHTYPLSVPHHMFLAAMSAGASVADALAVVATETGRPLAEVEAGWRQPGGARSRWLDQGFFVAR